MKLHLLSLFLLVVVALAKDEETPVGKSPPQYLWKTGIKAGLKALSSAILSTKKEPLSSDQESKVDQSMDIALNSRELSEYLDGAIEHFDANDMMKMPKALQLIGTWAQNAAAGSTDDKLQKEIDDMGLTHKKSYALKQ